MKPSRYSKNKLTLWLMTLLTLTVVGVHAQELTLAAGSKPPILLNSAGTFVISGKSIALSPERAPVPLPRTKCLLMPDSSWHCIPEDTLETAKILVPPGESGSLMVSGLDSIMQWVYSFKESVWTLARVIFFSSSSKGLQTLCNQASDPVTACLSDTHESTDNDGDGCSTHSDSSSVITTDSAADSAPQLPDGGTLDCYQMCLDLIRAGYSKLKIIRQLPEECLDLPDMENFIDANLLQAHTAPSYSSQSSIASGSSFEPSNNPGADFCELDNIVLSDLELSDLFNSSLLDVPRASISCAEDIDKDNSEIDATFEQITNSAESEPMSDAERVNSYFADLQNTILNDVVETPSVETVDVPNVLPDSNSQNDSTFLEQFDEAEAAKVSESESGYSSASAPIELETLWIDTTLLKRATRAANSQPQDVQYWIIGNNQYMEQNTHPPRKYKKKLSAEERKIRKRRQNVGSANRYREKIKREIVARRNEEAALRRRKEQQLEKVSELQAKIKMMKALGIALKIDMSEEAKKKYSDTSPKP